MTDHDEKETRRARLAYRRQCQARIKKSGLPGNIKLCLDYILEMIGSKSDYTVAWCSHEAIAKAITKINGSPLSHCTIQWYCKAIAATGILKIEKLGLHQARQRLAQYKVKLPPYAHRLSFYTINAEDPFWTGDKNRVSVVVETVTGVMAKRGGGKYPKPVVDDPSEDVEMPRGRGLECLVDERLECLVDEAQPVLRDQDVPTGSDEPPATSWTAIPVSAAPTPPPLSLKKSSPVGDEAHRGGGEAQPPQVSTIVESFHSSSSPPTQRGLSTGDKELTTTEVLMLTLETNAPRKSTDSLTELVELWKDRRPQVMALYRKWGFPPNLLVSDVARVMTTTFQSRLSLGALLGSRWDRFHKALDGWLSQQETRVRQWLIPLSNDYPLGLDPLSDEELYSAWRGITGDSVVPPALLIRKLFKETAIDQ